MAEKDFTEYERDLRDFEKKPLAKDRETLIFPPESDIKGSDKQDPSVLPAAPKLSMRKEAQEEDRENLDLAMFALGADLDNLKDIKRKTGKGFEEIIRNWLKMGDDFNLNEEEIAQVVDDFRYEYEGKEASKKISVNDRILTSSKKKAKVVKVSDELIFWVSMEGDDFGSDFADEVELFEEHEPFEEHGLGRGRNLREDGDGLGKGRREPVDEGIVKEIPLDLEEI